MWLDRGELDKVIERAGAVVAAAEAAPPPRPGERYDRDRGYDRRGYDRDRDESRGRRKKKGFDFLEDLFDF